jgi:chlorophyll synthase
MPLIRLSFETSPVKILRYLLRHMVPIFWGVTVIPFYMAWVFATRKLLPTLVLDVLTANSTSPGSYSEFYAFVFALLALGPFLGGFTLLYNDYWDSEVDRKSRRKGLFPLSQGLITHRAILRTSLVFMILAVLFSLLVSLLFAALVGVCIILSLSYSTPPVRLKNRAGIDVVTNLVGSGLLCSIAGWIVVKPLHTYPYVWGLASMAGVAAIYIPTTIIDQESDRAAGVDTIAVHFGKKNAYYMGVFSIAIANILIVLMCLTNYLFTLELLVVVWPIALSQVLVYAYYLRRLTFRSVYQAIMALVILLVVGNSLLLTYYVGYWGSGA